MTLIPALHVLRAKFAVLALGSVVLTAGQAVAKNHDCQTFKIPTVAPAMHDRAPGPSLRNAN